MQRVCFCFFKREIKKIHEEIKEDYLFAVKKSIVDFVLHEPEIDADERFLVRCLF